MPKSRDLIIREYKDAAHKMEAIVNEFNTAYKEEVFDTYFDEFREVKRKFRIWYNKFENTVIK